MPSWPTWKMPSKKNTQGTDTTPRAKGAPVSGLQPPFSRARKRALVTRHRAQRIPPQRPESIVRKERPSFSIAPSPRRSSLLRAKRIPLAANGAPFTIHRAAGASVLPRAKARSRHSSLVTGHLSLVTTRSASPPQSQESIVRKERPPFSDFRFRSPRNKNQSVKISVISGQNKKSAKGASGLPTREARHSTVTDFAKFLGRSTSQPRRVAT